MISILAYLIDAFSVIILARVVLSWFMMNPSSQVGLAGSAYQFLLQITEPFLAPLRRVLPRLGMLDLSPMVAIIILWILRAVLASAA
jgi:YggT family protein